MKVTPTMNKRYWAQAVIRGDAKHMPAEIIDLNIDDCMRHPALSKCCRILRAMDHPLPTNFWVFYLNTAGGKKRRAHMEDQFTRCGVPKSRYTRVEAETFPPDATKVHRTFSLTRSHARMWRAALKLEDNSTPGAIFMEDDVCLKKGWNRTLSSLVCGGGTCCDVVRFDVLFHFESSSPLPEPDSVFVFPCVSPYCAGVYYMSWEAIRRAIKMFDSRISEWNGYKKGNAGANERIIHEVGRSFGQNKYVQCVPPLAVQTWFLNDEGLVNDSKTSSALRSSTSSVMTTATPYRASQLQDKYHMLKLRTTICSSFLGEHGHRYFMSPVTRSVLGKVLRALYDPRSEIRYPATHSLAHPEWIWLVSGGDPSAIKDKRRARLVEISSRSRREFRSLFESSRTAMTSAGITRVQ